MTTELPHTNDAQIEQILALIPDAPTAGRVFDALFERWTEQGLAALRRQRIDDKFDGLLNSGAFEDGQVDALEAEAGKIKAFIASSSEIDEAEEDAAEIVAEAISSVTYRLAYGFVKA